MDPELIEAEVSKNRIWEGMLKKRSKYLKEWRDRWVVLTSNFIFTFTNQKRQELTELIKIEKIQGLKSYLKKTDDYLPTVFEIKSNESPLVFMARNLEEKRAWIATVERLVVFQNSQNSYSQSSQYKNIEDVRRLSFKSMNSSLQKKEENFSFGLENIEKMIGLFKSQEEHNKILKQEVKQILQQLHSKQGIKAEISKLSELIDKIFEYDDEAQIGGIIKGMIIDKRLRGEERDRVNKVIEMLLSNCRNQNVLSWGAQLKQVS